MNQGENVSPVERRPHAPRARARLQATQLPWLSPPPVPAAAAPLLLAPPTAPVDGVAAPVVVVHQGVTVKFVNGATADADVLSLVFEAVPFVLEASKHDSGGLAVTVRSPPGHRAPPARLAHAWQRCVFEAVFCAFRA